MPIKEKKRLEVVWESHEITTISFKRDGSAAVFCQSCKTETLHLTVREAASILTFSEFAIFRLAQTRRLHSTENREGQLLFCGNSVKCLAKENL